MMIQFGSGLIGTLNVADFHVGNGLVSNGRMTLGNIEQKAPFNAFMAAYLAGGSIPVTFNATRDVSNKRFIADAMQGMSIPTAITSPGYSGFLKRVELKYNTTSVVMNVLLEFTNLLPVVMEIIGFELELTLPDGNINLGRLVASAIQSKQLLQGESMETNTQLTDGVGADKVAQLFDDVVRGVRLTGQIKVRFGEVEADVGVGVDRYVSVTNDL